MRYIIVLIRASISNLIGWNEASGFSRAAIREFPAHAHPKTCLARGHRVGRACGGDGAIAEYLRLGARPFGRGGGRSAGSGEEPRNRGHSRDLDERGRRVLGACARGG